MAMSCSSLLPQHIQEDVLDVVASSFLNRKQQHPYRQEDDLSFELLEIDSIEECKSAQQKVFIVRVVVTRKETNKKIKHKNGGMDDSVGVVANNNDVCHQVVVVVLRIWYGGSCWWNMHRNGEKQRHLLAGSEIMGYTVARRAFDGYKHSCNNICVTIPRVYKFVNLVDTQQQQQQQQQQNSLSSSSSSSSSSSQPQLPYAILEYVGPGSSSFSLKQKDRQSSSSSSSSYDNSPPSPMTSLQLKKQQQQQQQQQQRFHNLHPSTMYEDSMIKIRHEFGFDEPHPRWGRVPTNEALKYAQLILHQVVLPIHSYCFLMMNCSSNGDKDNNISSSKTDEEDVEKIHKVTTTAIPTVNGNNGNIVDSNLDDPSYFPCYQHHDDCDEIQTYAGMVCRYRMAWKEMKTNIDEKQQQQQQQQQNDRVNNHDHHDSIGLKIQNDVFGKLDQAIKILEDNVSTIIRPFAPVLVHLDLQPQNIKFGVVREKDDVTTVDNNNNNNNDDDEVTKISIKVVSVLDWEDAAWADPRFEILMLCRKVCSNMDQTNRLWSEYGQWYDNYLSKIDNGTKKPQRENPNKNDGDTANTTTDSTRWDIGPVRPWLQLETVHSITTLLLQSMDLLHGGRNPWETKSDLWGKLEREFSRWDLW